MLSTVTYPDNFPSWYLSWQLPTPGCHVGCMFLMKITCQEGMHFTSLSLERLWALLGTIRLSDNTLPMLCSIPYVAVCFSERLKICLCVCAYVCVYCWVNGPLQLYYLAMNHEPSLQPAHCALKVKQTN